MFSPTLKQNLLDKMGLFLSVGCAIHCLVMSLLPIIVPTLVKTGCCHDCEGLSFHQISAGAVLFIGFLAFAKPCTLKENGKLAKLLCGFALIFSPQYFFELQSYETLFTVSGTVLVASAHWQNLMSYRRRGTCSNGACSEC